MPLVDMSLEQLQEYQGRNPRPDDFDEYWSRALAEMRAVKAEVELVRSEFQAPNADCFDLYFTGVRGARIHAKYVRPKNAPVPHPAILQFHGYTGSAGEWCDKLSYASVGYSVIAMDVRGQGGKSEDTGGVKGTTLNGHLIRGLDDHPDNLLFRHIFLDTAQLAGIAMGFPEVDPDRIGAMGASQGGGLTLACGALEPRIKRLAPTFPYLCDYLQGYDLDLDPGNQELKRFFRFHDPQHRRKQEIFTKLGYIDIQYLAQRIRGEVILGISMMDIGCPPSTQFSVYNKITAPKSLEIYPDFGHEYLPGFGDQTMQFFLGL
ncbi:acetylxylan esterase [Cohnella phaseoli]|uniref:Cephalosporin-C deacetylase n=1 Tax=Cohnella phaseoli TaxID=456490 RepID=A0A3D9HTU3_9BACL|nr:acetylxylan esterase [Cohnella phaseoli]RED52933.1 cephalosporin-C deacetylase [Cohnella phaseoli]